MEPLFRADPIRPGVRRGTRDLPMRPAPPSERWPPRDRDPADVAVVAARLLVAAGRIQSRLRHVARAHWTDPNLVRLLLLFVDANVPLRIGNVAELLAVSHPTASRIAARAHAAGLVDKFTA